MKKIFLLLVTFCNLQAMAQEDFQLRVNDSIVNIALDKSYNLVLNGQNLQLSVTMKDTLSYSSSFLKFKYPKQFKIASSMIADDVEQLSIISAEGTGIVIQKYESLNPSTLEGLVLAELTRESISYGYVEKKSSYKKNLASGQEVNVTRSVLTYKDEINIYEVTSMGKKDAGIMLITMKMDDEKKSPGQKVIDLMWHSLQVN